MNRIFGALILALTGLFCFQTPAQAQPCQWNYSLVNNVATATYCGQVVSGAGPNVITSIANLISIPAPQIGASYYVQGYNTPGDGGGGQFIALAGTVANDHCINFPGPGGTHFSRQTPGRTYISALECGAIANSADNGTTGTDATINVQYAIDYAKTNLLALYIPQAASGKCYRVNTLNFSEWKGIRIFGDNSGTAGINAPYQGSSTLCSYNTNLAFDFSDTSYGAISDLSFIGEASKVVVMQARTTSGLEAQNTSWTNVNFGEGICASYLNYSHEVDSFYNVNFHQGNGGFGVLISRNSTPCTGFSVPNATPTPSSTVYNFFGGSIVGGNSGLANFDAAGGTINGITIDGTYLAMSGASAIGLEFNNGIFQTVSAKLPRSEVTSSSGSPVIFYLRNGSLVKDATLSIYGEANVGGVRAFAGDSGTEMRGWSITTPLTIDVSGVTYRGSTFQVISSDPTNNGMNTLQTQSGNVYIPGFNSCSALTVSTHQIGCTP